MSKTDWKETEATVFTCGVQNEAMTRTLNVPGFEYGEYLITFSYEIDGQWCSGEFTSSTPRDEGSTFTLKYDSNNPDHNEYSFEKDLDSLRSSIIQWVVVIVISALCIWFWESRHH